MLAELDTNFMGTVRMTRRSSPTSARGGQGLSSTRSRSAGSSRCRSARPTSLTRTGGGGRLRSRNRPQGSAHVVLRGRGREGVVRAAAQDRGRGVQQADKGRLPPERTPDAQPAALSRRQTRSRLRSPACMHSLHEVGTQRSGSMTLEPMTQAFINSLSGPPLSQLSPAAAHKVLTDLQSQPIPLPDAQIEDVIWPVGPRGQTRIRIVRPATTGATEILPVILYTHGGGWVLGDKITHDRLVREIANGVGATVSFVG